MFGLFQGSIYRHVMKVVRQKIRQAQKAYVAECDAIDKQAATDKFIAQERAVESVIGKFL